MLQFCLLSSFFDMLTFAVLWSVSRTAEFQTAWFVDRC
jgi:hypothetical protein